MAATTCTGCTQPVGALEVFPGDRCLSCYAASPDGTRPLTADDIVSLWRGPARRTTRRRSSR